ncbi:MAG: NERD domain-containing protein [Alphaproteobacteria bacterium]|nr:NERD domain-containing protein [Alphaproteobacteria bacterium]
MKIIFAISRILFILFVWTIGYLFWLQRLMVAVWKFNPMSKQHWLYIWNEWKNGWVIQSLSEWMFVIILFMTIPVMLTGGALLCAVPWLKWFKIIILFPIRFILKKIKDKEKDKKPTRLKVTKKKSYKQTRPPAVRAGSGKLKRPEPAEADAKSPAPAAAPTEHVSQKDQTPQRASSSSSSSSSSSGSVMDILRSAGYRLISDAKIAGKKIDFVAVSADHILLCMIDSESGDWLADEERFNDEEPLWFSESNHRISPVRVVLNARDALSSALTGSAKGMEIKVIVVIRQGTIINAEDMFEVWDGLKVTVCRFEDGGPDEIMTLEKAVSNVRSPDDGLYHNVSSAVN